jgi:hypothetical protein
LGSLSPLVPALSTVASLTSPLISKERLPVSGVHQRISQIDPQTRLSRVSVSRSPVGLAPARSHLTQGLLAQGSDLVAHTLSAVQAFSEIDADNNRYGEHNFGSFQIERVRCISKIGYYDTTRNCGSEGQPIRPK